LLEGFQNILLPIKIEYKIKELVSLKIESEKLQSTFQTFIYNFNNIKDTEKNCIKTKL